MKSQRPKVAECRIIKESGGHADYCGCNDCRLVEETKKEFRKALYLPKAREKEMLESDFILGLEAQEDGAPE